MLLAEELLLLALDDESGRITVSEIDKGLAGAVLIELALLGRVRVAEKNEPVRRGRLMVLPGAEPGHPALLAGLVTVGDRAGRKPENVIDALGKGLRDRLADGLVEAGVLRREKHRVLGLFPTRRLPANDVTHERTVRERIAAALGGATPDDRTAALVALLSALDAVTTVFQVPDKRTAKRRAKEIAEGQWAAAAVHKAIQAVRAATMAGATVAASAAATSGG
jgi:hypothetical protein